MTWGSSMSEILQTAYRVELMLIVPGCFLCCPVAPVCSTLRCIMSRMLLTAESSDHALHVGVLCSQSDILPHCPQRCLSVKGQNSSSRKLVSAFGLTSKSNREISCLAAAELHEVCEYTESLTLPFWKVLLFHMPSAAPADFSQPMTCLSLTDWNEDN